MYEELIKSLRVCGKMESIDDNCIAFHDGCCEAEPLCMYELMRKAADAIEERQNAIDKLIKTNKRLSSQIRDIKSSASWDEDIRRGQVQGMW